MHTLAAWMLATPIWGFALQVPLASPSILPEQVAQVRTTEVQLETRPSPSTFDAEAHNRTMMDWTRVLNGATTVALTVTGVLGFIQFGDEYGFHSDYTNTACANGDAVLGYCGEETPWAHLLGAATGASLLISSFGVSTAVNFDRAARVDSDWRIYEVTRWVALGMGVLQGLAGFLIANAVRFDWADQQNDFDVLQGLAIGHMTLGVATLGMNAINSALIIF